MSEPVESTYVYSWDRSFRANTYIMSRGGGGENPAILLCKSPAFFHTGLLLCCTLESSALALPTRHYSTARLHARGVRRHRRGKLASTVASEGVRRPTPGVSVNALHHVYTRRKSAAGDNAFCSLGESGRESGRPLPFARLLAWPPRAPPRPSRWPPRHRGSRCLHRYRRKSYRDRSRHRARKGSPLPTVKGSSPPE